MDVKIRELRQDWPDDPIKRFDEIVNQNMARLIEINAIANLAIKEEATACTSIISEPLTEIKMLCSDALRLINEAIKRQEKYNGR